MDELEKLRQIVDSWIEHNEEHASTYLQWAERADAVGRKELSDILRQIAYETSNMQGLLKKAKEAAS
jgi:hypothetical protein